MSHRKLVQHISTHLHCDISCLQYVKEQTVSIETYIAVFLYLTTTFHHIILVVLIGKNFHNTGSYVLFIVTLLFYLF